MARSKSTSIALRVVAPGSVAAIPASRRERPKERPSISAPKTNRTEAKHLCGYSHAEDVRPWTFSDDADLAAAVRHGASLNEAAVFLCRSPDEVGRRGAKLALEWNNSDVR